MLLVLICGMFSGWTAWRVNRAYDQRRAVATIARAGGGVGYDHKRRPWAPDWIRKRIGDEFFQEVTSVQFRNPRLTDDDLAPLASLDRLEELSIEGAPITDSGLKHISNLTELRILSLWETRGVSDAGLVHLAALTKLQHLNLYRCALTDAGLVHLRRMTDLDGKETVSVHFSPKKWCQKNGVSSFFPAKNELTRFTDDFNVCPDHGKLSYRGEPGVAAAMADGPRSRSQCLQRLPGQLLHHDNMNRFPHRGQRKPISLRQVTTPPRQHAHQATPNNDLAYSSAYAFRS